MYLRHSWTGEIIVCASGKKNTHAMNKPLITLPHWDLVVQVAQAFTIPYHTLPYLSIPFHTIPCLPIPSHTIPYLPIPYHALPCLTNLGPPCGPHDSDLTLFLALRASLSLSSTVNSLCLAYFPMRACGVSCRPPSPLAQKINLQRSTFTLKIT